jgi:hypothetical protein
VKLCRGAGHGGGDGPPFVVSPGAVNEQHFRRVALAAEAKAPDQAEGGVIAWLDVGPEPVKPQWLNGVPHGQAEPFGHWASSGLTDIHHPGSAPEERMPIMQTMERKKPRRRRSFTPEFKAEIVGRRRR